jgi:hypothetical protein
MTNEQNIRELWSTSDLAGNLVRNLVAEDWDYDWDETLYSRGVRDFYQASDGSVFEDYDEAIAHELWWLRQEVEKVG